MTALLPSSTAPLFDTSTLVTYGLATAALVAAPGLLGDGALALVAGRARGRLAAGSVWARWRERITGTVLIGLGIRLALQSRR